MRFEIDGVPLVVRSAEGAVQRGPLTRESFADVTPPIFVDGRVDHDLSPFVIRGTGSTSAGFEARLLDEEGRQLGWAIVAPTSGPRGAFKETVDLFPDSYRVTLEVHESGADSVVRIPLFVEGIVP